jgi:hypothetical protein
VAAKAMPYRKARVVEVVRWIVRHSQAFHHSRRPQVGWDGE